VAYGNPAPKVSTPWALEGGLFGSLLFLWLPLFNAQALAQY